jgi:hypothetical protein
MLPEVVDALPRMACDRSPAQLLVGDLGLQWRFGAEAAAALRTCRRDGQILAVGMLDSRRLLRLAVAREEQADEDLAHELLVDITRPARGVLSPGM